MYFVSDCVTECVSVTSRLIDAFHRWTCAHGSRIIRRQQQLLLITIYTTEEERLQRRLLVFCCCCFLFLLITLSLWCSIFVLTVLLCLCASPRRICKSATLEDFDLATARGGGLVSVTAMLLQHVIEDGAEEETLGAFENASSMAWMDEECMAGCDRFTRLLGSFWHTR